jgi:hypothetical protein
LKEQGSLPVVKIEVLGRGLLDVVEQGFEAVNEGWSEYRVADGGIIRTRGTALRVYRVVGPDKKPAFTPDGQPDYVVTQTMQMTSSMKGER